MKKIYILSTIWMAFIVGACDYNDKNFDGLDDIVKPANVVKEKYTLVEADYAAISDNSTNKSIAKKDIMHKVTILWRPHNFGRILKISGRVI